MKPLTIIKPLTMLLSLGIKINLMAWPWNDAANAYLEVAYETYCCINKAISRHSLTPIQQDCSLTPKDKGLDCFISNAANREIFRPDVGTKYCGDLMVEAKRSFSLCVKEFDVDTCKQEKKSATVRADSECR